MARVFPVEGWRRQRHRDRRLPLEGGDGAEEVGAGDAGEVLLEEFIKALGTTQYLVAKDIGVPPRRVNEIVQGKRAVTADTALRLARYFGTCERFWLNLLARHGLEAEKDRLGHRLQGEVLVFAVK